MAHEVSSGAWGAGWRAKCQVVHEVPDGAWSARWCAECQMVRKMTDGARALALRFCMAGACVVTPAAPTRQESQVHCTPGSSPTIRCRLCTPGSSTRGTGGIGNGTPGSWHGPPLRNRTWHLWSRDPSRNSFQRMPFGVATSGACCISRTGNFPLRTNHPCWHCCCPCCCPFDCPSCLSFMLSFLLFSVSLALLVLMVVVISVFNL